MDLVLYLFFWKMMPQSSPVVSFCLR